MSELVGLRVLVAEDEGPIALMIEDMLQDLGCEIAASVARLGDAREIAATENLDLAVLDVNLGGHAVFPVAEILRERQIPFVFSTGYGASGLPHEFSAYPVLGKPFSMRQLQQKISLALKR
ncbi:response regulator [Chelativorans salis]|uniref:Response regulator n=1 Tax=Chelativorans salis TaxID=2978478 RepID=A0ABT2LTZ3_9HYPH|nr:response regulator [Chelativorans sp. EGI FJ00035]MCT7377307.1 response regulator [Chelativorans sp. EGI FJ00035]